MSESPEETRSGDDPKLDVDEIDDPGDGEGRA